MNVFVNVCEKKQKQPIFLVFFLFDDSASAVKTVQVLRVSVNQSASTSITNSL